MYKNCYCTFSFIDLKHERHFMAASAEYSETQRVLRSIDKTKISKDLLILPTDLLQNLSTLCLQKCSCKKLQIFLQSIQPNMHNF